mgnify:CR=1 FL=1|tara:strand:+ start:1078 stop:2127 length:1050 start_codon:yes stop_codon:yes gene_type:complete
MNDYMNHKWKNFLVEEKKRDSNILREQKSQVKAKQNKKTISLPTPKLSEQWGQPSSADRKEIEALLSKVARGGNFSNKVNKINEFVNNCKGDNITSCRKMAASTILSRLMALEIFTSIVYDFNASTGGFLFEVFVAALLGADAQQVIATQTRSGEEGGDIADIKDASGNPMSLKFFKGGDKGGSKAIKGSLKDLRASINEYGMPIPYLVAIKKMGDDANVTNIDFYEFTIGATEGVPEGMGGDFNVDSNPKWKKGTKFSIPTTVLTGKKVAQIAPIATLNFGSPEEMKNIAANYADQLGEDVTSVYNALEELSLNINRYFIRNSKKSGRAAIQNSEEVAQRTKKLVPNE